MSLEESQFETQGVETVPRGVMCVGPASREGQEAVKGDELVLKSLYSKCLTFPRVS
jgi:hypothetical protein